MNAADDSPQLSRRCFLLSSSGMLATTWIASQWPAIAAAARHAEEAGSAAAPAGLRLLSAQQAATVEAIAAQIVPSGATPGAREAHAGYFIDAALAGFFAEMAVEYLAGIGEFARQFAAAHPGIATFAAADGPTQIGFLKSIDRTPFFETTRFLTVLGMFSSPKYGGNFQGLGWKLLGFVDAHAFTPPFGYYDRDYPGFVPYTEKGA